MNGRTLLLAAALFGAGMACADDPPMNTTTPEQAQARQIGIFVGGTASQYDLCARKGFLAAANPSAEEVAKSILDKMKASNGGADQSVFVQQGWDMIKREIADNESFYTQERCAAVGREWAKMMANVKR
jgi:hypothetical protein